MDQTINIIPVRNIDWSNTNIERAGIIPIYEDDGYLWIGFGISNYSAIITPIGGSYEDSDHDLLSTAVREYNEEVEGNLPSITDEAVYGCYAIGNEHTIQILMPISKPKRAFTKTQELYDMLWLTTAQLRILEKNQAYRFPGSELRIFQFGGRFRDLLVATANAIDDGTAFQISDPEIFVRPRRQNIVQEHRIITDIDEFKSDLLNRSNFIGHLVMVITPTTISIMRKDTVCYSMPNNWEILRLIYDLDLNIYVSLPGDLKHFEKYPRNRKVLDILNKRDRIMRQSEPLTIAFRRNVMEARIDNNIVEELLLMISYEKEIYQILERSGSAFMKKRAEALSTITYLNNILSFKPMNFDRLLEEIKYRRETPPPLLLKEFIRLRLYNQEGNTIRL